MKDGDFRHLPRAVADFHERVGRVVVRRRVDDQQRDGTGLLRVARLLKQRRLAAEPLGLGKPAFALGVVRLVPQAQHDLSLRVEAGEVVVVVAFGVERVAAEDELALELRRGGPPERLVVDAGPQPRAAVGDEAGLVGHEVAAEGDVEALEVAVHAGQRLEAQVLEALGEVIGRGVEAGRADAPAGAGVVGQP